MSWARAVVFSTLFLSSQFLSAQRVERYITIIDSLTQLPIVGAKCEVQGTFLYSGLDGSIETNEESFGKPFQISAYHYTSISGTLLPGLRIALLPDDYRVDAISISVKSNENTEGSARFTEFSSQNLVSVISSQEIDISPDMTVANVLQRVSGVSLERNSNGDGQHAIVRGMDKRYNYTLVNGIKIPSPDNKNRYVPLDIFPSELLDRLEVTKALTPNMEGDAVGGVINMKMKDAPSRKTFSVNLGTGYNSLYTERAYRDFSSADVSRLSPHAANGSSYLAKTEDFQLSNLDFYDKTAPLNQLFSASMGNRFAGGKVGGIVALSYQNTYRGSNSMFLSTFIDQETNTPYYEILQLREYSAQQERLGLHSKWDWQLTPKHSLKLYSAFVHLYDKQTRNRVDTILKIARGQGPGTGRVELRERSQQKFQTIFNTTLQGEHQWSKNWSTDWSLVYSLATHKNPDMAEIMLMTGVRREADGSYTVDSPVIDRNYTRRFVSNSDQDISLYLNNHWNTRLFKGSADVSFGGMMRLKDRQNEYNAYTLTSLPIGQIWSGSVYNHTWTLFNSLGTPTDPLNYQSAENIYAAYAQVLWKKKSWQILSGGRYEITDFYWVTQAPRTVKGRIGELHYADLLPSVHIKKQNGLYGQWRASWFKSISRPGFFEVIPYDIQEEDYRERGNPNLQHTQASNWDLRYEYFDRGLNKAMIGLFYKVIQNPIESALVISGQTVFIQPNNFGTAYNGGLEFDFSRYFGKWGVRAFYTFTDSRITTSKIVKFRDSSGSLTQRDEDQTRPLEGQSRHISNVSLLYKNPKSGTDLQLAMVYTGNRIISVSPYKNNDVWQRAFIQLDVSGEQAIKSNWKVYFKVNNLLNTPLMADIHLPNTFNPEQAPYLDASKWVNVRHDVYGINLFLGLKYKF